MRLLVLFFHCVRISKIRRCKTHIQLTEEIWREKKTHKLNLQIYIAYKFINTHTVITIGGRNNEKKMEVTVRQKSKQNS